MPYLNGSLWLGRCWECRCRSKGFRCPQWLQNVRADPRVRVYVGSRRPARATARLLSVEESAASLAGYATRRPRAWARLKPVMEATLGARIDAEGTTLPMIAFDLAPDSALTDRQSGSASRTDR